MRGYNIINKEGQLCGWSGKKRGDDYINVPVKLLMNNDRAYFNKETNEWEYQYEDNYIGIIPEETEYSLIDYNTCSYIYNNNILPDNGDINENKDKDNISILIPCYYKSQWIKQAVQSSVEQEEVKPKYVLVLLMDDESKAMKNELESLSNDITTVTCYESEELNSVASRNKLVELCQTEWFVFLDGDDCLRYDCLKAMYEHPSYITFPSMQGIDKYGEIIGDENDFLGAYNDNYHTRCMQNNMTFLMTKTIYNEIGLDEDLCEGGEDFDFIVRLLALSKYDIGCTYNSCVYYRQVDESLTKKKNFYESRLNSEKKNLEFLHSEFVSYRGYDELEDRFYNNPSLETIYETVKDDSNKGIIEDKKKIVIEKDNRVRYLLDKSRYNTPISEYDVTNFEVVNYDNSILNYLDLDGKMFDVLFLQPLTKEVIFNEEFPMIINKTLLEQIQEMKSNKLLTYLLENFYCVVYPLMNNDYTDDTELLYSKIENASQVSDTTKKQLELVKKEKKQITKKSTENIKVQLIAHKVCNQNCEYCILRADENVATDKKISKRAKEVIKFLDKNVAGKNIEIQLLGGEPTLWSDDLVKDLLNQTKKYKKLTLFTNGYNKDSLFYDRKSIRKHNILYITHISDWKEHPEKLYKSNLQENEIAKIVITTKDYDDFKQLVSEQGSMIKNIQVRPCIGTGTKLDFTSEQVDELNNYLLENGFSLSGSVCEETKTYIFDLNTEDVLGSYCCNSSASVPYEEVVNQENVGCKTCPLRNTIGSPLVIVEDN